MELVAWGAGAMVVAQACQQELATSVQTISYRKLLMASTFNSPSFYWSRKAPSGRGLATRMDELCERYVERDLTSKPSRS
jgi:hypothetical protein